MNNLDGAKSPGIPADSVVGGGSTGSANKAGKLAGSPVSLNPDSATAKKVGSLAEDQTLIELASAQESQSRQNLAKKLEPAQREMEEKILKIIEIVQKGRSMQGYPGEVLSYEGYQLLVQIKEKQTRTEPLSSAELALLEASHIQETLQAIISLKRSLQTARMELIKGLDIKALKEIEAAIKAGNATDDQVKFVVGCKRLWMDLATEEGSYLGLLDFVGKKEFEDLKIIKDAAFIQGPQADMLLNQMVLEDHLKNKPAATPPLRFLVEGAGPNGLYAAFQFLRSGASVSVVNDRSELPIRNQNMILDPKWIAQLNFLLGSKFDELFVNPKALGVLNLQRGSGTIKTQVLEDVMKARAAEISSYIEDTQLVGKESFLNLHYEASLKGIQSSAKGFSAIIGAGKSPTAADMFHKLAIEKLTKKILSEKYAHFQPGQALGDTTVLKKAQEEAAIQWRAEQQAATKIEKPAITFDFLACVGGANDVIRDEFLDPAVPYTSSRNYGIASWLKPANQADKRYFSQDTMTALNIRTDHLGYPYLTRQHIENSLRSQNLDQFLAASGLPDQFKIKYQNLTEKLLHNIETTHLPNVDADQDLCGFNIRTFENYSTVFLAASTPPLLTDFLHDLNQLIASSRPPEEQQLKNFKKEIDKKWMNTLAGVFAIDPSVLKLDDEYPINVGTFDVQQKGIDTAAKLLVAGDQPPAVIAAFGDSRISPHFFSGSGMSSGRLSIERGADVLRGLNRGEIRSKSDFVTILDQALDQVKDKAIDKGRRFVKPNTPSERGAAKFLILKNKIKEYYDLHHKPDFVDMGWRIETEVNDKGEFDLSFKDKAEKQQLLKVTISPEDGRLMAKGKKYPVLNDLLLDLKS